MENLAAQEAELESEWLAFSRKESFAGVDLNGDGDTRDSVLQLRNLASGDITNLGLAGIPLSFFGSWLVAAVSEPDQGRDLNGDGDTGDSWVLHAHDASSGQTRNLGLTWNWPSPFRFFEGRLVLDVLELFQGEDLNGDGIVGNDPALHLHDLDSGETTNLGIDFGFRLDSSGRWFVFGLREQAAGEDLNGDGDTQDVIAHVYDIASGRRTNLGLHAIDFEIAGNSLGLEVAESAQGMDLNDDGDTEDFVLFVHDLPSGTTTNLKLTGVLGAMSERWLALVVFGERPVVHVHDLVSGETTNLHLGGGPGVILDDLLALRVTESEEGTDLNGDGDTRDIVLHVHDLASGRTTNLGLNGQIPQRSGNWLIIEVLESEERADLNGDGDRQDSVFFVHDLRSGTTTNLGLAVNSVSFMEDLLALGVWERSQGEDLNGDGDREDFAVRLFNLASGEVSDFVFGSLCHLFPDWLVFAVRESPLSGDLNGDGDTRDTVLHARDLASGRTTNLRLSGWTRSFSGDRLLVEVEESSHGLDLDGDGRTEDRILHLVDLARLRELPVFLRGDCNGDGRARVQVSDAIFLLDYHFRGGREPACLAACDADGNGHVDELADALYLLAHSFLDGPAPVEPFPDCGATLLESTAVLGCESPPVSCPR